MRPPVMDRGSRARDSIGGGEAGGITGGSTRWTAVPPDCCSHPGRSHPPYPPAVFTLPYIQPCSSQSSTTHPLPQGEYAIHRRRRLPMRDLKMVVPGVQLAKKLHDPRASDECRFPVGRRPAARAGRAMTARATLRLLLAATRAAVDQSLLPPSDRSSVSADNRGRCLSGLSDRGVAPVREVSATVRRRAVVLLKDEADVPSFSASAPVSSDGRFREVLFPCPDPANRRGMRRARFAGAHGPGMVMNHGRYRTQYAPEQEVRRPAIRGPSRGRAMNGAAGWPAFSIRQAP